jgi:hypothetical protein
MCLCCLISDTDNYGKQEDVPDGDTSEEVDPYDLVFGCPDDAPDFGCSDAYNSGEISDSSAFDNSTVTKETSKNNAASCCVDFPASPSNNSGVVSRSDVLNNTGDVRPIDVENRPQMAGYCDVPGPRISAVGAPNDNEDSEMSADNDHSELTKTIDGVQCTRTVLDGVTFYEYDYPSEDEQQNAMCK